MLSMLGILAFAFLTGMLSGVLLFRADVARMRDRP